MPRPQGHLSTLRKGYTNGTLLCLDARPAADYPTVEIRVCDVCTEVDDAVLVAALCRALVETGERPD